MTEKDIIYALMHYIDGNKYPFRLFNSFVYKWESDFLTIDRYGTTREFEIKVSKSDFKQDSKKDKHGTFNQELGDCPNYFYYVCPEGLITKEDVDPKYGILWVKTLFEGHSIIEIHKKPKKLHDKRFDKWKELASKYYYKFFTLWNEKRKETQMLFKDYKEGLLINLEENDQEPV